MNWGEPDDTDRKWGTSNSGGRSLAKFKGPFGRAASRTEENTDVAKAMEQDRLVWNRGSGDVDDNINPNLDNGNNQSEESICQQTDGPGYAEGRGRYGRRGIGRGGTGARGRDRGGHRESGSEGFDNQQVDDDQKTNSNDIQKPKEIYIPPEPSECEEEIFQSSIQRGVNFGNYFSLPITVTGDKTETSKSINNFEDLNLRTIILENIKKSGYEKPTPIQKVAIPLILAGQDIMACAQTGSGKTAAFLLPIINNLLENKEDTFFKNGICQPQALIVSPTRELAIQIAAEARKFAHTTVVKIFVIYGGTSTMYQSQQVSRGCHILVVTPGRLNDFLQRRRVSFALLRFVVLDEADRMLDMGFQSIIQQILNHETMISKRQTLLFSATFPNEIQTLGRQYLQDAAFVTVGLVGSACADVEQHFFEVNKFEKREKLLQILQEDGTVRTVIFIASKRNTDFVAVFLSEKGLLSTSIHGDRLQREREEALRDFRRGSFNILVATNVAARGLDIKNVDHVINYDLPKDIDEYVHRIGRTGRVGNKGRATSFYDEEQDAHLAPDLVKILRQADQTVPNWLERAAAAATSNNNCKQAEIITSIDEPEEEEEW